LTEQEKGKTNLVFKKNDNRDECIAKVEKVIERYIKQNIENLKLLLNAYKDVEVMGIDKLPTVVKRRLQNPKIIVENSVYWDLWVTGAFKAKGKVNPIQTKKCLDGSVSFAFLKTYKIDGKQTDHFVFENRESFSVLPNVSYFKKQVDTSKEPTPLKIAKVTTPLKIAKEYFKENCMKKDMTPDEAVEEMKKVFPELKIPKDKFKVWRNRLKKEALHDGEGFKMRKLSNL
jgi:hypothetical protein